MPVPPVLSKAISPESSCWSSSSSASSSSESSSSYQTCRTPSTASDRFITSVMQPSISEAMTRRSCKATPHRGLQRIIDGLYLAFEQPDLPFDATTPETLETHSGQSFTHIVNLTLDAAHEPTRSTDSSGAQRLTMGLPALSWAERAPRSARNKVSHAEILNVHRMMPSIPFERVKEIMTQDTSGEGLPSLGPRQLVAARDFLVCSGFDASGLQDCEESELSQRLLIVCPRNRGEDAIAALLCFISFVTEMAAQDLLIGHERDPGVDDVWKGLVSARGTELVDRVAFW